MEEFAGPPKGNEGSTLVTKRIFFVASGESGGYDVVSLHQTALSLSAACIGLHFTAAKHPPLLSKVAVVLAMRARRILAIVADLYGEASLLHKVN